jgi:hypothetical protein
MENFEFWMMNDGGYFFLRSLERAVFLEATKD